MSDPNYQDLEALHAQLVSKCRRVRCLQERARQGSARGQSIQAITQELTSLRNEAHGIRERAKALRQQRAIKSTRAFLEDKALWDDILSRLDGATREAVMDGFARVALDLWSAGHEPEGAGYGPMRPGDELDEAAPESCKKNAPVFLTSPPSEVETRTDVVVAPPLTRSDRHALRTRLNGTRADLLAAGILKEPPAPPRPQEKIRLLSPPRWAIENQDAPLEDTDPHFEPARGAPRRRGVCGKVCFESEVAAKRGCRRGAKRAGFRIRAYFCVPCRAWHVTNNEKR